MSTHPYTVLLSMGRLKFGCGVARFRGFDDSTAVQPDASQHMLTAEYLSS
jgi:hypothetical protein